MRVNTDFMPSNAEFRGFHRLVRLDLLCARRFKVRRGAARPRNLAKSAPVALPDPVDKIDVGFVFSGDILKAPGVMTLLGVQAQPVFGAKRRLDALSSAFAGSAASSAACLLPPPVAPGPSQLLDERSLGRYVIRRPSCLLNCTPRCRLVSKEADGRLAAPIRSAGADGSAKRLDLARRCLRLG